MEDFDVAIVGARCAGASLAIILARKGFRVCLIDRAHFPSETPSTHIVQPSGVAILYDLVGPDAVLATGAVPLRKLTLVNEDVQLDGHIDPLRFPEPGLCMRRLTLDTLLVEAAARAGADVRTGCRAAGLVRNASDRVIGVETNRGAVSARLVVGADGRHSTVAETTGAAKYLVTPPGRLAAWAYFDAADREGRLRLARVSEHAFLAAPADNGLYMAAVTVDIARRHAFHADRGPHFAAGLAQWPELADLLSGAEQVGPIRVIDNWHGYFRQSAGPGWVLVGDAGHFKDFTAGQGISDALRQARKLAKTIVAGFADDASMDDLLQRWWRWRDRDAYAMYWFAHDMGVPGVPTPLVTRMLRDIASDQSAVAQFLGVMNHDLSPARLLTPGRMAKAAIRALRDRPDLAGATLREIASAVKDQSHRAWHRAGHPSDQSRASTRSGSALSSFASAVSRSRRSTSA
jgi:flavin-dependent dehydrogenase